ncbi:putative incF replication protein RepA3 [Escherichia coli 2-474-04_S4_C1]|nr:putative incF replication protein RepA3 [Escherichia coli 2-474-04_S4_C1]
MSTERSLELFRAYNYTPRIAELLAIRFLVSPGNLSDSPKLKKIIGVFAFLAPVHPHQNQFPATLRRGQPQNSLNDQQSNISVLIQQETQIFTKIFCASPLTLSATQASVPE